MGYLGSTYTIPCNRGGLTANPNIDLTPPEAVVDCKNINLHQNGKETRGGTEKVNSTAIATSPQIMGGMHAIFQDGTTVILAATSNGYIYKDYTTALKSGLTNTGFCNFVMYANKVYFTNLLNRPQTWDGSAASTSDLVDVPTDWLTDSNWPKYMIAHGRGVSRRLWAFGCANTPNRVYASQLGTDSFSDANVITLNIETGSGSGIVGAVEFGERLIFFSKTKAFIIDDTSATTSNWGYAKAIWEGGVAHHRLIIKTLNDVLCMTEDGDVYSIGAVQSYGDYHAASIARPAFIDRYIREKAKLTDIEKFHAIYDTKLRLVRFFFVRVGMSVVDSDLVYFIDKGAEEGWSLHDNTTYASGHKASCSFLARAGAGDWRVYTGDYAGFIWKLETNNSNDDSNPFRSSFKTPRLVIDNSRGTKHFNSGVIVVRGEGGYSVNIDTWVDEGALASQGVSLSTNSGIWGTSKWDNFTWGGELMLDKFFDIKSVGKRIQFEIYNDQINKKFYISQIHIDFKPLSVRPA